MCLAALVSVSEPNATCMCESDCKCVCVRVKLWIISKTEGERKLCHILRGEITYTNKISITTAATTSASIHSSRSRLQYIQCVSTMIGVWSVFSF